MQKVILCEHCGSKSTRKFLIRTPRLSYVKGLTRCNMCKKFIRTSLKQENKDVDLLFIKSVMEEDVNGIIYSFNCGANINATDVNGDNVLHKIFKTNKNNLFMLLIDLGVNFCQKNNQGLSPLCIASLQILQNRHYGK